MNTKVYLGFADPDWHLGMNFRELLAFHALTVDSPIIQDNFFLCGALERLGRKDPLVCNLLETKVLGVALRKGMDGFTNLNVLQAAKAKEQTFVPFTGDTPATYSSDEFKEYAKTLQRALEKGRSVVEWMPSVLGLEFKKRMLESIHEDPASERDRLIAFKAAQNLAEAAGRDTHTRSDYWKVAARHFSGDRMRKVKNWASSYYLTNLPHKYGLGSSMPNSILPPNTPLKHPWEKDPATAPGPLHYGLYNRMFLRNVSAKMIIELRSGPFVSFQDALSRNDFAAANGFFRQYAEEVARRAPEVIPTYTPTIRRSRRIARVGKAIADHAGAHTTVTLTSGALILGYFLGQAPLIPVLATAVGAVGTKLLGNRMERHGKEAEQKAIHEARRHIESRYDGNVLSLVDFVHREA